MLRVRERISILETMYYCAGLFIALWGDGFASGLTYVGRTAVGTSTVSSGRLTPNAGQRRKAGGKISGAEPTWARGLPPTTEIQAALASFE